MEHNPNVDEIGIKTFKEYKQKGDCPTMMTSSNEKIKQHAKEDCQNVNCEPAETTSHITATATFKKPNSSIGLKRSRLTNTQDAPPSDSVDLLGASLCKSGSIRSNDLADSRYSDKLNQEQAKDPLFSYVEPPWGGKPDADYKLEVLKSGVIMETISLSKQSFNVVGRLPSCDVPLAHPTVSRYHAVLQYRSSEEDETQARGLYVYDLESTHGTFWNGHRIRPKTYVRVRRGHMLKFGCSQRKYILLAPCDDQEDESEYTVTELKEIRALELKERVAEMGSSSLEEEEELSDKEDESGGISWGMGEDADEATDLQENPYANIADEGLTLENPKKTLRGWFEREGYDLQYQTEEKSVGQFLCWVDLPLEDITGRSVRAEALVKGKKKEAVVQCALEACKILDKYKLLRQANYEGRKRKRRNWEDEDYYDSDEDNFLDRTGTVERKREYRMRQAGKLEEKVETYESLLKKQEQLTNRMSHLINSIKSWQGNSCNQKEEANEEDELDAFMLNLNSSALTKNDVVKMKLELQSLRKEEATVVKLLNLTRPANLPALIPQVQHNTMKGNDQSHPSESPIVNRKSTVGGSKNRETRCRSNINIHLDFSNDEDSNRESVVEKVESEDASVVSNVSEVPQKETTEEMGKTEGGLVICNSTNNCAINPDNEILVGVSGEPKRDGSVLKELSDGTLETSSLIKRKTGLFEKDKERVVCESMAKKKSQETGLKVSCDEDVYSDNYSMWVPPGNQSGDGKTSLNEKYGY